MSSAGIERGTSCCLFPWWKAEGQSMGKQERRGWDSCFHDSGLALPANHLIKVLLLRCCFEDEVSNRWVWDTFKP